MRPRLRPATVRHLIERGKLFLRNAISVTVTVSSGQFRPQLCAGQTLRKKEGDGRFGSFGTRKLAAKLPADSHSSSVVIKCQYCQCQKGFEFDETSRNFYCMSDVPLKHRPAATLNFLKEEMELELCGTNQDERTPCDNHSRDTVPGGLRCV